MGGGPALRVASAFLNDFGISPRDMNIPLGSYNFQCVCHCLHGGLWHVPRGCKWPPEVLLPGCGIVASTERL